jgi:hypothetical protein
MLMFASSAYDSAREGYYVAKTWRPLAGSYSATVIGFPIWGNGEGPRIATVRITFPNGKTADFNTSHRSNYSNGDTFRVLTKREVSEIKNKETVIYRRVYDVYEIDDPYILWESDAIYAALVVVLAVAAPFFGFHPYYSAWKAARQQASVPPVLVRRSVPRDPPRIESSRGGSTESISPSSGSPANITVGFIFGALANYLAVHCYLTGEMIGGTRHGPSVSIVDARANDPVFFWVYLGIVATSAVLLDLIMLKLLYNWLRSFGERRR